MKREDVAFEVLKMARELVINEHTDHRAQLHNRWLAESELLWATKRIKLAYPAIPPYPTEADILERAEKLLSFLFSSEKISEAQTNISEPESTVVEPESKTISEAESTVLETESEIADYDSMFQKKTQLGLLPAVMKKIDELKNIRKK